MICELCGKDVSRLRPVRIEGSVLSVCTACVRFGEGVKIEGRKESAPSPVATRLEMRERRMRERDIYEHEEYDLVPDFPALVRKRREGLGLSQEDLGRKLNERKSVIQKLEAGDIHPDDKLVAKLEKVLGISLREKRALGRVQSAPREDRGLTLGDLIRYER
ncbi:MAG: multiprotein bridging factor aMBF1 [Candidatus Thermoplasmatota archaeon]